MREAIKWGLQVNKRTVRMIKLERLWKCGVGTGKVEMLGLRLAKEARGGRRGPAEERELSRTTKKKVMMLMNDKKLDAGEDLKLARVQFHKSKKELWKEVPWMSRAGAGVREVLRVEMAMEWEEKRRLMARSVKYLVDKFRRGRLEEVPDTWRGVKISDVALGEGLQLPPPFLSEGVGVVTQAAKEVLQLPPKTAVFLRITLKDVQVEVVKAVEVKARWELMEKEEMERAGQTRKEAMEEERLQTQVHDKQGGILRLHNMRVTSLPTNKEVILPDERPEREEAGLRAFGTEMIEVARKYIKENVDKSGNLRERNLTATQEAGLKDIQGLISHNHVVTKTDKSDRLCLLTEHDYIQTGEPHVENDIVKTRKEMDQNEDILNCHALQMCRILGLCDGQNCARRLKSAIMNQNTFPPSLYFTIKDHKQITPGEPLPARPVCGATRAHNGQLGFMLAKVLDAASDILAKENKTESHSTQDMLATIEEKINNNINIEDLVFFSTDVKSLYPRLQAEPCAAIIARMLEESSLEVEGVNWDQAVHYLALTLDRAKVMQLGLDEVVPRWRKARGRAPGITTKEVRSPLQEQKDWETSLFFPPTRMTTLEEKKIVLSLCVEQGLLAALGSHLYNWHREVKEQQEGLPIGLDLTRAVARLVLLDWDQQFLRLARANNITLHLYYRYMDDTANGAEALRPGIRWSEEEERMMLHPHLVEEDLEVASDIRTAKEVAKMGSSISNMISLTWDCPSNNDNNRMALLNTEVWVEDSKVWYEHYRKPVANPLLMMQISAMPAKVKRTTLVQEVVTILRNIRPGLPREVTLKHLNNFCQRMKASGYNQHYRFQVVKSGMLGYDKMLEEERRGGRPVNQLRTWDEDRRQKKKEIQGKNWFRRGGFDVPLFVPHTPHGELAKRMKEKEVMNNQGRNIRFKIVEKSGVSLEQKLRKSNPWGGERCGRQNCFQCKTDEGGDCWRESVTYSLVCEECGEDVCKYFGESGRNGFSRGEEHLANLEAADENKSILKLHSIHHHNGREVNFTMKVTDVHSSCLDRQVTERVNIENFQGPILMNRRNEMGGVRVDRMQYRRWGGD